MVVRGVCVNSAKLQGLSSAMFISFWTEDKKFLGNSNWNRGVSRFDFRPIRLHRRPNTQASPYFCCPFRQLGMRNKRSADPHFNARSAAKTKKRKQKKAKKPDTALRDRGTTICSMAYNRESSQKSQYTVIRVFVSYSTGEETKKHNRIVGERLLKDKNRKLHRVLASRARRQRSIHGKKENRVFKLSLQHLPKFFYRVRVENFGRWKNFKIPKFWKPSPIYWRDFAYMETITNHLYRLAVAQISTRVVARTVKISKPVYYKRWSSWWYSIN